MACIISLPKKQKGNQGCCFPHDVVTELTDCEWTGVSFLALLSCRGSVYSLLQLKASLLNQLFLLCAHLVKMKLISESSGLVIMLELVVMVGARILELGES